MSNGCFFIFGSWFSIWTYSWWLNDKKVTEEEFLKQTQSVQEMTMEELCKALGKIIKIVK